MSVKLYKVYRCQRYDIKDFIEIYHYSNNINGLHSLYCFKLVYKNDIIGALIYGYLGMANVWRKYAENEKDIIELNRLCCIDDTFKNTESYFIAKTIKWLKHNTNIKTIISYADPTYNHTGIIYKASNFKLIGMTSKSRYILYKNKKYHDKTIRTKHNGILKPYAVKLKKELDVGNAKYINTEGKYIYIYSINRKKYFKIINTQRSLW